MRAKFDPRRLIGDLFQICAPLPLWRKPRNYNDLSVIGRPTALASHAPVPDSLVNRCRWLGEGGKRGWDGILCIWLLSNVRVTDIAISRSREKEGSLLRREGEGEGGRLTSSIANASLRWRRERRRRRRKGGKGALAF